MGGSRKEVPIATSENVDYYGSADSEIRISNMSFGDMWLTQGAVQSLVDLLTSRNPLFIHPRDPDVSLENTVVRVLEDRKETPLNFCLSQSDARRVFAVLRSEGIISASGRGFGPVIQNRVQEAQVTHVQELEGRCAIFCERGLVAEVVVRSVSISRNSGDDEIYCNLTLNPAEDDLVSDAEVRGSFDVGSRMHSGFLGIGGLGCPYVGWRLYTAARAVNGVREYVRKYPGRQIGPKDVRNVVDGA